MLTVQGSYWKSRVESPTFVHSLRLLLRAPLGGKPIFSPWIQQTIEEIIENQYNQNMINSKCKIHLEINTWNSKEVFHYKKIGLAFRKHLRVEAFEGELEPQKALVQKRPLSEAKTQKPTRGACPPLSKSVRCDWLRSRNNIQQLALERPVKSMCVSSLWKCYWT